VSAEIAILNNHAVALAADSAATIGGGRDGPKTYNSDNKLFKLSESGPVGIMVYGDPELNGVPWETVIALYRRARGKNTLRHLHEYAQDLASFIESGLFSEAQQRENFLWEADGFLDYLAKSVREQVRRRVDQGTAVSDQEMAALVAAFVKQERKDSMGFPLWPGLPEGHADEVRQKYQDKIRAGIQEVRKILPISSESADQILDICVAIFTRDRFPELGTGIVIAGFGEDDVFPGFLQLDVKAVVNNRLHYGLKKSTQIDFETDACIQPFAQHDMVNRFMSGIDPELRSHISSRLADILREEFRASVLSALPSLNAKQKKLLSAHMRSAAQVLLDKFEKELGGYCYDEFEKGIITAVRYLPMNVMAAMAESLVALTSLKHKVAMEAETVGGPIDVAVISKSEGFVWVKHKQYFRPELNPECSTDR
jgi:hypothetical protein